MGLLVINKSKVSISKKNIERTVRSVKTFLSKKRVRNSQLLKKELTIVFLDPKAAQQINHTFRKKNYPTDVLSFTVEHAWGELVICPQVIRKQSKEHKVSFNQELALMIIHGCLHLLGYDHEKSSAEAKKMQTLQEAILTKWSAN